MVLMMVATLATVHLQQRTDTTFTVQAGARLELNDVAGDVRVQTWDKQQIRITAEHGSRDFLDISVSAVAISVRARSRRGQHAMVDYQIWVPATTPLDVSGPQADITVTGLKADISAETVEGAITVRGGAGYVSLKSNEGAITLEGARGHIQVNNVDGDITLRDVAGQITVESVDGDILLDGIDSDQVEANSVDGAIGYRGTIKDGGTYRLASHDGDVTVALPETTNATVSVATQEGGFDATFPVTVPNKRKGKRFTFTLGNGSGKIELESFEGNVLLTKGTLPAKRHE